MLNLAFPMTAGSPSQAIFPHAIIVVNRTKIFRSDNGCDEDTATRTFLELFNEVLDSNHEVNRYTRFWTDRGRKIQSLEDLLTCFYASITIIRMPATPAYMRIKDQVLRLYMIIERCCYNAYKTRVQARMLLDANTFHAYLQSAFDHFAIDLDEPFNFIEVTTRNNSIPSTFAGNIDRNNESTQNSR
jgi:hypothetical protein